MDHQKDEIRIDFLQCLDSDMAVHIVSLLNDLGDIVRASAVSRFWRQFVIANGLAKKLCLKAYPELSNIVSIINGSDEKAILVETTEWEIIKRDQKVYGSLLQALTKSKVSPKDCIANAVCASSTDHYPDESVINTLNPRDRFIRRASYWSSKGQSNPEVPETLIYKLRGGIWVITEIDIQPFEAFFQPGKPIYSAKSIRFRVGHPKPREELEIGLKNLPWDKPIDHVFIWTYTSQEFPMAQENRLQPFKLPEPVLCVGGYLQIELLGRVQRQEMDELFYICVCYVRVLGRSLFPAFEIEMVDPSTGRLVLKYYLENLSAVLENSSNEEAPHLRQLEEEMLWDRIGLLEDLLRGIQRGPYNALFRVEDNDGDGANDGAAA